MANLSASTYKTISNDVVDRVNLGAVDNNVEGGSVIWVANATDAGVPDCTVLHYDRSRFGEYDWSKKPHVIVKCSADCSVNNYLVKDEDGNTLYTFNTDCSAIPKYVVLRLITGDRNTISWELA